MAQKLTKITTIRLSEEMVEALHERFMGASIARICRALLAKLLRGEIELTPADFAAIDK